MSISGLLITLADDPRASESAVSALRADHRIELGERRGPCLPVVSETADHEADRRLWRELNKHDGIVKVDVVFVHFDDEAAATPGAAGPETFVRDRSARRPTPESGDIRETNRHVDE